MACEQVTLQDVCELIVDCPHTSTKDEGVGYPLIRTPNVGRGRLILTDVHRVSQDVYERRVSRAVPRQGDLILAREAPAGNVAIVPPGIEVCLGQRTMLLRPDSSFVVPEYLNYYLNAPEQRDRMLRLANGATVSHINVADIRNMPVQLPSRGEQSKVAELLNVLDDKIDLNNRLNDYLANLCETIASRYCNDRNSRLRDICYQVADHVDYDNANQETYVSTESLMQNKGGRQLASSLPTTGKITRYKAGDTLISNIRPYFKKIWYAPFEGTCSGDVIVFRANDPSNAPYLHACLRQDSFFDYVMQGAKGTKMPRGDKKQMMEFKVASSCSAEDLILLDSVIKQRSDNDSEITKLQKLRDTLLPKLMSGEIDVSKIDLTQLTNNHLLVRGHNVPNRYWKEHLWKPSLIMFCHRCRTCSIRRSSNIWPKYSESRYCQLRKHQRRRIC